MPKASKKTLISKRLISWPSWKTVGLVVIAIAIFYLGVMVGEGRLSFNFGHGQNQNLPARLDYSSVNQAYNLIKNDYDGKLTTSQVLDGLKAGLAQSTGDPYTEYFNASQASQFNNELNGSFSGIGAELGADSNGNIEVIAPLADTPAARAGLAPHDIIASINGKDTSGLTIDGAVNLIRGPSGSKVTLGIVRGSSSFNVMITRTNITVPSVNYKILDGNIGYMQINQFTNDTSSLAEKAAKNFVQANVKGVILDLRDNPGGEVDAAVNVSSLWLSGDKQIMQEKTGNTVLQTYYSTGNDLLKSLATVVLINEGSASASEITAGALHDNNEAYIIGQTSYGKGVVQELDNLGGGAELKVTIAHWYRPNGQNINHKGIMPDQTVADPTAGQVAAGTDPQLQAAETYLQSH